MGTRTSNRHKTNINHIDNSDDDSDYEPKPKRIQNPNVSLREPSSLHQRAQKISLKKYASQTEGTSEHPIMNADPERNKKCPHCTATFYYTKGVNTHIAHAHSDLQPSKISSVLGINTGQNTKGKLTTDEQKDVSKYV